MKSNLFPFLIDKLLVFYSKYCEKIKIIHLMEFILGKRQILTVILIMLTNFNIKVDRYKFALRKY